MWMNFSICPVSICHCLHMVSPQCKPSFYLSFFVCERPSVYSQLLSITFGPWTSLNLSPASTCQIMSTIRRPTDTYVSSATRFHQCGVMPIQNRVKFRTVTTVYKSRNGLTHDCRKTTFESVSNISTRSPRLSTTNSLYIPKRNLCVSQRALHYSGATLHNTLNSSTQSCSSLSSFKHRTFKHFM